jgi:hypothetical protein
VRRECETPRAELVVPPAPWGGPGGELVVQPANPAGKFVGADCAGG